MNGPQPTPQLSPLDLSSLDFSNGVEVLRSAKRFVLPVPNLGDSGESLVYPPSSPQAGQSIKDPSDRGIVFFNGAGNAWEGARGDGTTTIIINNVTPELAVKLTDVISSRTTDVSNLSLNDIKEILSFAANGLGLRDIYPKKKEHIDRDLTRGAVWSTDVLPSQSAPYYGVLDVVDRKPAKAIFLDRAFRVTDPSDQTHPNGGFILESEDGHRWPVETQAFLVSYKFADGRQITSVEDFASSRKGG